MAFVVEDGTGTVATANAYISTAEMDSYWLDRGTDLSTFSNTVKQQAIVRATDYIDLTNDDDFMGRRLLSTQPLEFPRACLYANNDPFCTPVTGIPVKLKHATAEYAFRALTVDLLPDPVVDATGLQVKETFEKVAAIEERITFLGSVAQIIRSYPKADAYLACYTNGTHSGSYRA